MMAGLRNAVIKALEPRRPFVIGTGSWSQPIARNTEGYLKAFGEVGWLYASVSRIGQAVADAQWHLYRTGSGERKEIDKHPLIDLLNYVNPFQTGHELFELSQINLDLVGECFWIVNRNRAGIPGEIWCVPPNRMKVVPSDEKFIAGYVYEWGNQRVPLDTSQVICFKYPNPNNLYRGLGPAQSISVEIDTESYSGQWNRNIFYNGGKVGYVVSYPENVAQEDYERLREQWNQSHGGLDNAHRVAILGGGAKIDRAMLSPIDMDFYNLRHMNRDFILGAFGMPLSVLGIVENVNRANAEAGEYTFARWVVQPRLTRFREKLNEQLCPLFGDDLEVDYDNPVPQNRELIISEAERATKAGLLTRNEGRQLLGYDPIDGEDVFIQQAAPVPPINLSFSPERKALAEVQVIAPPKSDARWETFSQRTEAREKRMVVDMRAMFAAQEADILAHLEGRKSVTKQSADELFDAAAWEAKTASIMRPLVKLVLKEAAEDAIRDNGLGVAFDLENPRVAEWLGSRVRELSHDITGTTKDAIAQALREGHATGESIPKLADRLKGYFTANAENRSVNIARTESIYASNRGAIEAYRQSGVVEKWEWLGTPGMCDICEPMAGKQYELDAQQPPLHPQCRCAVAPVVKAAEARSYCPQCKRFLGEGLTGKAFCPRCNKLVHLDSHVC